MMEENATQRISTDEAHRRFPALQVPPEILYWHIDASFLGVFRKAPESSEEVENFRKHCIKRLSRFNTDQATSR
jgi:hypothetical protein